MTTNKFYKFLSYGLIALGFILTILFLTNNYVAEFIAPTPVPMLSLPTSNYVEKISDTCYKVKVECSNETISLNELLELDDSYNIEIINEDTDELMIDLSKASSFDKEIIISKQIYYLNRLNEPIEGISTSEILSVNIEIEDTSAPIISKNTEIIEIVKGMPFTLSNYVSAYDTIDGDIEVTYSGDLDTNNVGTYDLSLIATDSNNNSTTDNLQVKVIQKYFDTTAAYSGGTITTQSATTPLAQAIVDAATSYLGISGVSCDTLVRMALSKAGASTDYFSGQRVYDPLPGDIIYYSVNSLGTSSHVAVYIGENMAVHGGWLSNQDVVIAAAYMDGAAYPAFYRVW